MAGTLYVVGTPIGNLEDVSFRAVEVFRRVSLVACEDTRVTKKLLGRHGIQTPTVSYHEHNEPRRAAELVQKLLDGLDVALATDAGTPGISDPGYRLVGAARRHEITVVTIPGPSAVVAALSISGLPTDRFCFHGFLPTRPTARRSAIRSLASVPHTIVLFESARRLPSLLDDLAGQWGPRDAFVAREMSKLHEESRYGDLVELARWARSHPLRGEMTVVVAGCRERHPAKDVPEHTIHERFLRLTGQGLSRRRAVKQLARETGLPTRDIYRDVLRADAPNPRGANEDS